MLSNFFLKIKSTFSNFFEGFLTKFFAKRIDYINGPQTLPPPLSKEEESALLEALSQGDLKVKEQLIVRNLRLVVYIARKYDVAGASVEDIISIGTIGLIKAVNTFSPEKNIKLATYASRCIENEILMYIRKTAGRAGELSLDEPLNVDWDGNELLLSEILGSDPDLISNKVEHEDECRLLNGQIALLNDRERHIMNMRFGLCGFDEHTQKEVADKLGISQSYISRLEKRIIKNLKKTLTNV
ncbi:MAG: RNA polymerase sporulation sigma factor SigE [Clostridia bacterium]|nr:RNA polymerase sporulation sigma factor SigE [Clostridia bacterium]